MKDKVNELAKVSPVFLALALINLRVKLFLTPAWFDGTLQRNHRLLLQFDYYNNEQSRLLQFFIPELFTRLLGLSIPDAYMLQRWAFVFLAFLLFYIYLEKWFEKKGQFAGVVMLSAIMPLTYFNHLQESAPFLMLTFLLGLWAIRENRVYAYMAILLIGAMNNETMLILPAVFFLQRVQRLSIKDMGKNLYATVITCLPAYLYTAIIRYITRDNPHLGGAWHLKDNIFGIIKDIQNSPLHYWGSAYLYIFIIFGVMWIYPCLKYSRQPRFLQRAFLIVPVFIAIHLVTGIILEVRQMIPLGFIIIPMAMLYLFPSHKAEEDIPRQRKKNFGLF